MRTVHETEALRPSDPIPKSMLTGTNCHKPGRTKIIIKTQQSYAGGQDDGSEDAHGGDEDEDGFTPLPSDLFYPEEVALTFPQLFTHCRRGLRLAQIESEQLLKECDKWEAIYKREWLEKEVLLAQVIQSEVKYHENRKAVVEGMVDIDIPQAIKNGVKVEEPITVAAGDNSTEIGA